MNRKSTQFMLSLTNMNRFKIGFGPISASVPSLHALATKEAERMLPKLKIIIILGINFSLPYYSSFDSST